MYFNFQFKEVYYKDFANGKKKVERTIYPPQQISERTVLHWNCKKKIKKNCTLNCFI